MYRLSTSCRMGSIEPFTIIEGPEAWTAADYKGRTDWINNLSEQHVRELDAAISGVIAKGIKDRDIHVSTKQQTEQQKLNCLDHFGPALCCCKHSSSMRRVLHSCWTYAFECAAVFMNIFCTCSTQQWQCSSGRPLQPPHPLQHAPAQILTYCSVLAWHFPALFPADCHQGGLPLAHSGPLP